MKARIIGSAFTLKCLRLAENDNKNENSKTQVIKFIEKYSKNRIIILITHDKSLKKYTTRTIELKNGKILKDIKN